MSAPRQFELICSDGKIDKLLIVNAYLEENYDRYRRNRPYAEREICNEEEPPASVLGRLLAERAPDVYRN